MEVSFLRKIDGKTNCDRIKNEYRKQMNIDKLMEGLLRWFEHVCRMSEEKLTKTVYYDKLPGKNTAIYASITEMSIKNENHEIAPSAIESAKAKPDQVDEFLSTTSSTVRSIPINGNDS